MNVINAFLVNICIALILAPVNKAVLTSILVLVAWWFPVQFVGNLIGLFAWLVCVSIYK